MLLEALTRASKASAPNGTGGEATSPEISS